MSSGSSANEESEDIEVLFEEEIISSEDPPWEEWSSLRCMLEAPVENEKQLLYEQGLYEPPSAEICAKYIALSDSTVFRHPYYYYPAVLDPGIEEAVLKSPCKIIYADDGQELYLTICEDMGECPCRLFYHQLLEEHINLRYYSVSKLGVRPMAMALKHNRHVTSFDLTDNFLTLDACFHLGDMLIDNCTLTELILSGCKIGPEGARRLVANLHENKTLKTLVLSKNYLTDDGVDHLGKAIYKGAHFTQLNLSSNNLSSKTAATLAEAIEFNNRLTHLDLSWNSLLIPKPIETLCQILTENTNLTEVNLSWNAITNRFINALKNIFLVPNIERVNLSNNRLCNTGIEAIAQSLQNAKKLDTLDLSYNPLSFEDAKLMVRMMRQRRVKLQHLKMDGVTVNEEFIASMNRCLRLKFRKGSTITHGCIDLKFVPVGPDMRKLLLSRAQVVCDKPKKKRVDVGLLILELQKLVKDEPITHQEFPRYIKMLGAFQMNEDLVDELGLAFPGPKRGKFKTVNVASMAEYVTRLWPDAKLPPTPPPPPPPPPTPPKGKDKGKPGKPGKK